MRRMYQAVLVITAILMVVAPVMALAQCGDGHFRCCGINPAAPLRVASCPNAMHCDGPRAERQDAPDVRALSCSAQTIRAKVTLSGAMPEHSPATQVASHCVPADPQPVLCVFLI